MNGLDRVRTLGILSDRLARLVLAGALGCCCLPTAGVAADAQPLVRRVAPVLIDDRPANAPATIVSAQQRPLYEQNFETGASLKDFVMSDAGAWRWAPASGDKGRPALELARQSKYQPAVRSPVNIALIANKLFGDFILEVNMLQTGKEYGHRDMCIFFGVQNPTNFYYVHLATAADDHAHNVFIVRNAPRTKIARTTTEGVRWGLEEWHTVRLERHAASGSLRVYFDDMTQPVMFAQDNTFGLGYIGFGSFDDTGKIAQIRIWGPSVEERQAGFYQKPQ